MILTQTAKAKEKRMMARGAGHAMEIKRNSKETIKNLQNQSQLDRVARIDNIYAQTRWLPKP